MDLSHVEDAIPTGEAKSRGGNRSPYKVFGKQYWVLDTNEGYREQGIASWYGKKFHGHKTSNGEVYDMYGMSAAHKSLQLPSFVRITNLDNDKQVVVRVNDRGPFHDERLIDLSYAAAYKLEMLQQGTARVEIEVLNGASLRPAAAALASVTAPQKVALELSSRFIQVGAFSSWSSAQSVKTRVGLLLREQRVSISRSAAQAVLYRVRIGPLPAQGATVETLQSQLLAAGFGDTQVLDLP
tara:strand:- start:1090 stop:1809 length:720 start_codon:yes stop_codon:yes gene_type:complete